MCCSATHRLSINLPIAHRLWAKADAVLAIGTRLFMQQSQWGVDGDLKIVRIDIDPEAAERFKKPAVDLIGDAADYAKALSRGCRRTIARARRAATSSRASARGWSSGSSVSSRS